MDCVLIINFFISYEVPCKCLNGILLVVLIVLPFNQHTMRTTTNIADEVPSKCLNAKLVAVLIVVPCK